MGAGDSVINSGLTITLADRPTDNAFYWTGERVEGILEFVNNHHHSNLKLKGAYIELIGEIAYTTQQTTTCINGIQTTTTMNSNIFQSMHTTSCLEPLAIPNHTDFPVTTTTVQTHELPFFNQRQNFLSSMEEINNEIILQHGIYYKWSFSFDLPCHLPPSLPADSPLERYAQYFLCVTLKRNRLHRNNFKSIPLTVCPRLNVLHYPHYSLELENENRKDVHLHAIISQNFIVPGTNISIQYDLRNPKRSMTDRIEVRLVQYRQMSSCGTVQKAIVEMDVPYIRKPREEYLEGTFNLKISDIYLPPTWPHPSSSSELVLNSNIVSVKYELTMTVKLHGTMPNFLLMFPITMGTPK
ncbi:unnamed protein product [Rotaria sp. Silwood2]|nr:unnamed protein product [Rotaria sp. Silwood2]CAF4223854.1 unnamed protein product [Rotaria sp. Silwood2]